MPTFPKLFTGAVAQYPSSRRLQASTRVLSFIDGSEQRYPEFARPVQRWLIQLTAISEGELAALEEFFATSQGAANSFAFVDPWDGKEYPDCSFEGDSVETLLRGEGQGSASILIRNNQV